MPGCLKYFLVLAQLFNKIDRGSNRLSLQSQPVDKGSDSALAHTDISQN